MSLNLKFAIRAASLAGGVAGSSILTSFPAVAVETLSDVQCREARAATLRTLREFTGKMSAPLAQSFGRFSETCDLATKFETVPGVDDKAMDTFRFRINSIRTSAVSKPATLAKQ